ncbi:MAG: lipopolysaccharide biosynthesis protein [Actinobacteria bacterium]|nr:lipopolysaccharide biosynthesis protein [Actinomycetota bacterium]
MSSDGDEPARPPDADAEPGTGAPDELGRRTIAGIHWSYVQTIVSAGLQIVMAAVLARLLTPAAFGLVALANLSLRFVTYFAKAGIAPAVIQKRDLDDVDVRAAFTSSVGLGLLFGSLVWAGSPLAAAIFRDPGLVPVLRWMSLAVPLAALGAVADALLYRDLRLRALAVRRISSYVIGYLGVGLPLAVAGAGVYALVAAVLTQIGVGAALAYAVVRHPVTPSFDRQAHRSIFGFGSRVSVISFFEFIGDELDTMAVGRFTGTSAVGVYNRAYLIVRLPLEHATTSLSSVLFPAFSATQDDVPKLARGYLAAISGAAGIVLPLVAGIGVAAPEVVLVLLGEQWTDAIPVVPWIAAAGAVSALSHFSGVVAEARATLNPKLAIAVSNVVVFAGLLWLARGHGLWAYGAALAGSEVYAQTLYVRLTARVIESPVRRVLAAYVPGVLAAVSVAVTVAIVRFGLLAAGAPLAVVFTAEVLAGAAALVANLHVGSLRPVRDDLHARLRSAGYLTRVRERRWLRLLATVVIGRVEGPGPGPASDPDPRP